AAASRRDARGNAPAASWGSERIARLARAAALAAPAAAVYPPIATAALFALDRLHAQDSGHRKRLPVVRLPTSFRPEKSDLASMILTHASAYATPRDVKPGDSFMEFAAAHRRSFRGAYADYIDFVTAVTLGAFLGPAAYRG